MKLADEYQCVNLIKQCIKEIKITPENAFQILPYAAKYRRKALPEIYRVNWSSPTTKLKELSPEIESKEISNAMLLSKCRFLESIVVRMQNNITSVLRARLKLQNDIDARWSLERANGEIEDFKKQQQLKNFTKNKDSYLSLPNSFSYNYPGRDRPNTSETTEADSCCYHRVHVNEISKTKSCPHCIEKYKKTFLAGITGCENMEMFFGLLQSGDEIATAVRKQK